uniref:HSF-type DNA-binding domain-containing protein n=1 Tax=Seriola dumerili TaxID=41447 RepID=A0A3B4V0F5_SERDU
NCPPDSSWLSHCGHTDSRGKHGENTPCESFGIIGAMSMFTRQMRNLCIHKPSPGSPSSGGRTHSCHSRHIQTGQCMDVGDSSLPDSINPNNFPAKLWRLVNNPANKAICWDSLGKVVVIDQKLFERQILSSTTTSDNADAFKTNNFSSFVRQLNLYGFRKSDLAVKDRQHASGDSGTYHHFYNPNFQRNHPELVASMKRLTVDNKAKIQAGLNVNCRPPSRYLRHSGGDAGRDKDVKRGNCFHTLLLPVSAGASLLSLLHQESTHPYCPRKAQAMTGHNGTPVPPHYLIRGHGAALSPSVFAADKGTPVSLSHHYSGVAPSSNVMQLQQGLMARANHGNPNFTSFNSANAQCQSSYQSPGEHDIGREL